MKYIIAIITVLTIYSCRPSRHRENIEVVFYPGLVELNDTDSGIINSIVEPDKVYTITSDDYTFLHDSLPSLTTPKTWRSYIAVYSTNKDRQQNLWY